MVKSFIDKDFLLEGKTAKELFHDYADKVPVIDYHCHINAAEIYENKKFNSISDAWLGGDHYKWRLIRSSGVDERLVTGDASGWEKFQAFANVLPRAIGNPIYHWAHLELKRFFDCDLPLTPETAGDIWELCNKKLADDENLRARGLIRQMQVEVIVTTDDPADSLEWHKKIANDKTFETKVLPGWRPDAVMNIDNPGFLGYLEKLGKAADVKVDDSNSLKTALIKRIDHFNAHGCNASDHGMYNITYAPAPDDQLDGILKKRLSGETLATEEVHQYRYAILAFCAKEYSRLGWVMELHFGALRNVNSVMFDELGPDTGYDCIGPAVNIPDLAAFLSDLNKEESLPKTLIFSINPADNPAINTLALCFSQEGIRSKVQQGSAWWFNDTYTGMEQQIISFAEAGVLADFVGMLTDSRSFLSYVRHEYFRRILCNVAGNWVDTGKYPYHPESLGAMIQDICYYNAKCYFGF